MLLLLAIAALGAASDAYEWTPLQLEPIDLEYAEGSPSVYVLMLDGYPRADTLRDDFGYDNSPFLDEMAERGFDVYADSHSNYDRTPFTLISMFALRHLEDVEPLWESVPRTIVTQQHLAARALLGRPTSGPEPHVEVHGRNRATLIPMPPRYACHPAIPAERC